MKAIKIIFCVTVTIFLAIGIPIIINECYKANCGYITVWSGADVLRYYGAIFSSTIAVAILAITIVFTKKQIQRDAFLKNETEKWDELKKIFLQILRDINPMRALKDVMDNGVTNPTKAINLLQRYQIDCKMATDVLNAHLNRMDYPKFKNLIDGITAAAEEFVGISQKEIDQYSSLQFWLHRDTAYKILKLEEERPGCFSSEDIAFNMEIVKKCESISYNEINKQIMQINSEFIRSYEERYKELLQLTGATFEMISAETQRHADSILSFSCKRQHISVKRSIKEVEKGSENN